MRTLIIGDSQALGPGVELEKLLEREGDRVVLRGVSGHGAADWRRLHWPAYQQVLAGFKPERVVLIFGSNDPPNRELHDAMQAFKASTSVPVYYAGPPRYGRRHSATQERGAVIRNLAMTVFGPRYLDAWPSTGPEVPRAGNGLHFTRAGAQVWARAMLEDLHDAEASPVGLVVALGVAFVAAGILWATLNQ